MMCQYHPELVAAAVCSRCRAGLCSACTDARSPSSSCFDCGMANNRLRRNQALRELIVSVVVGVILAVPGGLLSRGISNSGVVPFVFFYFGFSGYWGRRSVQRATRRMGGLAVLGGAAATRSGAIGLAGLAFGVLLWLVVGVFSGPIECGWSIYQAVRLTAINRRIDAARMEPSAVA
jgi:hypothetical protein